MGLEKQRNRWTHPSVPREGAGQLVTHAYRPERWDSGDEITTRGSVVSCSFSVCALRGPDTGVPSDVSTACYLRCKKTMESPLNVQINLCQRSRMPGT